MNIDFAKIFALNRMRFGYGVAMLRSRNKYVLNIINTVNAVVWGFASQRLIFKPFTTSYTLLCTWYNITMQHPIHVLAFKTGEENINFFSELPAVMRCSRIKIYVND